MTRATLIRRIEALSDEQFDRIAPYVEADLAAADDMAELLQEIERGRESARIEPRLDDDAVFAMARERSSSRS